MEILKETKYGKIFTKYGKDINQINIFEIENELDKLYFEKAIKVAKKNDKILAEMIGQKIDFCNIIWIYRVKKHYDFSEEETKNIIIDYCYKLKKNELQQLLEAKTEKELTEILEKTYYSKNIDFSNLENLEDEENQYFYDLYRKHFNKNIFKASSIYAYFGMIELENNDILNIVEGIRYNLEREKIRKKLVR